MADSVLLEIAEGVAQVTLNRPESLNALDQDLGAGLIEALEECRSDSVRAVVITGAGRAFCAGGDLKFFAQTLENDPTRPFRELTLDLNRIICALRFLPKPVLAAVNGAAGGAGISLACACDLRFAADDAVFRQAYTAAGLTPDGAWTLTVPLLTGVGRAAELLFLNPVLKAERAMEYGLVNAVWAKERLMEETMARARELAAGPTLALARAKDLLNRAFFTGIHAQLEWERQGIISSSATQDYQEGITAFLNKRTPRFNGR